ncbi:hypothetical protein NHH03_00265 [Stieleria sp. TO1_6]|uniref:hypothetical protein n=1 Tax=Stieleria tagensis TaxID=2956795 RepID=UPI00209B36E8|nr:hypothetical protein [Stieleria tagensis]MCO8120153.1 hypothetical protein [Stieleria tagensis]
MGRSHLVISDRRQQRLAIPTGLVNKLAGFRRALLIRMAGDMGKWVAAAGLMAFWILLVLDRAMETPQLIRAALWLMIGLTVVLAVIRLMQTALQSRTLLQIAELIRNRMPMLGDHLVGALELADSRTEQARSTSLCVAALEQVSVDVSQQNLHDALPVSRSKLAARVAIVLSVALAATLILAPGLVMQTTTRLLFPLYPVPRFTFVSLAKLPETLVVPHDEESPWQVALTADSSVVPGQATMTMGGQRIRGRYDAEGGYPLILPRLIEPVDAVVQVGDAIDRLRVIPKMRPELTDVRVEVILPDYLQHRSGRLNEADASGETDNAIGQQLTGGQIEVVRGSTIKLHVNASTSLQSASVDGDPLAVAENQFSVSIPSRDEPTDQTVRLDWMDQDGLQAAAETEIVVHRFLDRGPTLFVESDEIPSHLLNRQQLNFRVLAEDDFAVRRVGMQWTEADQTNEQVLAGGVTDVQGAIAAVFQPSAVGALSGEVQLRFWVEDDFPDRERRYSDPIVLNVLSTDEHAVWIAGQFDRWRQSAMDVRDQELNLFQRNRELSQVAAEQRDAAWRQAVAQQSEAEAFNGRQLQTLAKEGENLLRQAARNDAVATEYVETLAETLATLQGMAQDRMPQLAERLKQAAAAEQEESEFAEVIDQETSMGSAAGDPSDPSTSKQKDDSSSESERLGLAGTTVVDTSNRASQSDEDQDDDPLQTAIDEQTDLVAEFDAVAEQLSELLGKMEGSTLVKRLKSISRLQDRVAMQLGAGIGQTFGQPPLSNTASVNLSLDDVAESSRRMRSVLDDLEALCERRNLPHFAAVLNEIQHSEVLDRLSDWRERLAARPGTSIAIAEFWADTMDRWADDLIDPGSGEAEQGPKSSKSLPPTVVLDVLRVLESEVNLREQTRVVDQGRGAMQQEQYSTAALRLGDQQTLIRDRLEVVVEDVNALPGALLDFAGELEVLQAAVSAMDDAKTLLIAPDTGPPVIAAQTEAIELLLRSSKVNPASGSDSGGGAQSSSGGETDQVAALLIGRGLNELAGERVSETELSVGRDRGQVPEQWREGLDRYFQQLEQRLKQPRQPATGGQR